MPISLLLGPLGLIWAWFAQNPLLFTLVIGFEGSIFYMVHELRKQSIRVAPLTDRVLEFLVTMTPEQLDAIFMRMSILAQSNADLFADPDYKARLETAGYKVR